MVLDSGDGLAEVHQFPQCRRGDGLGDRVAADALDGDLAGEAHVGAVESDDPGQDALGALDGFDHTGLGRACLGTYLAFRLGRLAGQASHTAREMIVTVGANMRESLDPFMSARPFNTAALFRLRLQFLLYDDSASAVPPSSLLAAIASAHLATSSVMPHPPRQSRSARPGHIGASGHSGPPLAGSAVTR